MDANILIYNNKNTGGAKLFVQGVYVAQSRVNTKLPVLSAVCSFFIVCIDALNCFVLMACQGGNYVAE